MMDSYKDCRIISLNSNDALKLNGNKSSDLVFDFKNVLESDDNILYSTIGIIDAQIPVSWYLIETDTNTLNIMYNLTPYTITLSNGNYNANNLIIEIENRFREYDLAIKISLNKVNGLLSFDFNTSLVTLEHIGSEGLFRILGFDITIDYFSTVNNPIITPPFPLSLLGIQRIKLCSSNLSTISNLDSNRSNNNILGIIPIDAPSYSLITYTNKLDNFGRIKSRNIDMIDIQLLDEFGRFIQMNGISFCVTLSLIIYRKIDEIKIGRIEPLPLGIVPEPEKQEPEIEDEPEAEKPRIEDNGYDEDTDLGLLLYENGGNLPN